MNIVRRIILVGGLSAALTVSAQVGNHPNLLDPNTATAAELLAAPAASQAVVDAIVAARPVLNMLDLDRELAKSLSREQLNTLYARVFRQINLNTAVREEIMLIPGMTARMAHEFEEYRPYTSLEQFRREIGKYVDAAEVARLEQYVFVPMNLNTASGEDFLTIPGMSNRMVHEFEEYRPYTSMEQFRREIGKYVDANEVARLESYVTID
jgi:DNA uptake protein ComE-like DNA-binding protein